MTRYVDLSTQVKLEAFLKKYEDILLQNEKEKEISLDEIFKDCDDFEPDDDRDYLGSMAYEDDLYCRELEEEEKEP